ncbi:cytidylate kinase [Clostridium sp. CAG:1219]|nr:cytidylate kinase [Clostridium sp. CAG:1219]
MVKLNKKIIIAIDGGPGTGKSTVSDYIANKLNIVHIDTGAMFRAVGYFFVKNNIKLSKESVISNLDKIDVKLEYKGLKTLVFLNNEDVTDFIRTNEVSMAASYVSKIKEVRKKLLELQRNMANTISVVLDGQDIGTVVFPNADFKFYFTCSMEVRAKRRTKDLNKKGNNTTYEEVKALLEKRDRDDRERKEAPILKAEDAIDIDTSYNTVEETAEKILNMIAERIDEK